MYFTNFRAVYIAMGSSIVANSLLTLLGFILYAYYAYCDPLDSKLVKKADQVCHTRRYYVFPKCWSKQAKVYVKVRSTCCINFLYSLWHFVLLTDCASVCHDSARSLSWPGWFVCGVYYQCCPQVCIIYII